MTEISDKKTELFNELVSIPSKIVQSRKAIIEKAKLAIEMRDTATALGTDNYQEITWNLGQQKAVLKGSAATDQIHFRLNSNTVYQQDLGFTFPTVTQFAYNLFDNNGDVLPLDESGGDTDIANYYLVRNKSTSELVSIDDDLTAYTGPQKVIDAEEVVKAEFLTEGTLITNTLSNNPLPKVYPIPTVEFYIGSELIAEADEIGNIYDVENSLGTVIDESASIVNYSTLGVDLEFSTLPLTESIIKANYDYYATSNTTSEDHTDFDSRMGLFFRSLSNTPIVDTITIWLNGEQKAAVNALSEPYGFDIDMNLSFYDDSSLEIGTVLPAITEEGANVVTFNYIIEDIGTASETIGGFLETSSIFSTFNTTNGDVDISSISILFNDIEVAVSDSLGVITGTYLAVNSSIGVITGTITLDGLLDLTFTAESGELVYPFSTAEIKVQYDFVTGLSDWESTYDYVDIIDIWTNSDGLQLLQFETSPDPITSPPELLKTYPLKSYLDHQIYGKAICVVEGLEINTDWIPIFIRNDGVVSSGELTSTEFGTQYDSGDLVGKTIIINEIPWEVTTHTEAGGIATINVDGTPDNGSSLKIEAFDEPENATLLSDSEFKTYLTWLNPDYQDVDDILKTANPNNASNSRVLNDITAGNEARYSFNNSSDILNDDSASGNDAEASSNVTSFWDNTRGYVTDFNGTTSQYDVSVGPTSGFFHDAFATSSYSVWVKMDISDTNRQIIMNRGDSTSGISLYYEDGLLGVALDSGNSGPWKLTTPMSINAWHHIATTFDSGVLKLFLDGEFKKEVDLSGIITSVASHTGDGTLGYLSDTWQLSGGTTLDGKLDDFRVYTSALTNDSIKAIFDYTFSIFNTSTAGYPSLRRAPFFPATDGTYTENDIFKGNFIHYDDNPDNLAVGTEVAVTGGTSSGGGGMTIGTEQTSGGITITGGSDTIDASIQIGSATLEWDTGLYELTIDTDVDISLGLSIGADLDVIGDLVIGGNEDLTGDLVIGGDIIGTGLGDLVISASSGNDTVINNDINILGDIYQNSSLVTFGSVPSGVLLAYGGDESSIEEGWLLCDGSAYDSSTYPTLFSVIDYTYGGSGGSFNVPDMRQRFPLGKAASGTGSTLGSTGGNIDHTHTTGSLAITIAQMPLHNHTFTGSAMGTHNHGRQTINTGGIAQNPGDKISSGASTVYYTNGGSGFTADRLGTTADSAGTPTGTIGNNGSTNTHNHGTTGTGNAPFQVVNYIIKI